MPTPHRQIIELRIESYEVAEIAEKVGRSKRTVERLLQECRKQLGSLPHGDDQLLAGGARRDGP